MHRLILTGILISAAQLSCTVNNGISSKVYYDNDADHLFDNCEVDVFGTNPEMRDTDNDGLEDSLEDHDNDGCTNKYEQDKTGPECTNYEPEPDECI